MTLIEQKRALEKALDTIAAHPINEIITAETWRLIVEDMQTLARAALSNEEAGEADPVGKIVAYLRKQAAEDFSGDEAASAFRWAADEIERGDWKSTPVPSVNGTDEPPNAILAGVREDAGRTDWTLERILLHIEGWRGDEASGIPLSFGAAKILAAALREAGGRGDHVERIIQWMRTADFDDEAKEATFEAIANAIELGEYLK